MNAVLSGLEPHREEIGREVTRDDVDTLLKIPIRRISLYDIERARKESREIEERLKQVAHDLGHIVPYAIAFLENLIENQRPRFPRRTEILSLEKVDVREAAKRDLKLAYDKGSGYLGYEVNGPALFEVSQYDRVLVIRADGSYSVIDAPDKLFVGKGMAHCGFVDKDTVFNLVYRDAKGRPCIKRCVIDKFILNRSYELVPEGCKLLRLTTRPDATVSVDYKPKPRVRVLNESFAVSDYPVRGLKARGDPPLPARDQVLQVPVAPPGCSFLRPPAHCRTQLFPASPPLPAQSCCSAARECLARLLPLQAPPRRLPSTCSRRWTRPLAGPAPNSLRPA